MLILKTPSHAKPRFCDFLGSVSSSTKDLQNGSVMLYNGKYVRKIYSGNTLKLDSDWYDFFQIIGAQKYSSGDTVTFTVYSKVNGVASMPTKVYYNGSASATDLNRITISSSGSSGIYYITVNSTGTSFTATLKNSLNKQITLHGDSSFTNIMQVKFQNFQSDYWYYILTTNNDFTPEGGQGSTNSNQVLKYPSIFQPIPLSIIRANSQYGTSSDSVLMTKYFNDGNDALSFINNTGAHQLIKWKYGTTEPPISINSNINITATYNKRITIDCYSGSCSISNAS